MASLTASGPFYVYDRLTDLTTVYAVAASTQATSRSDYMSSITSSLLTNVGRYILYIDMAARTRRDLLRDELALLPGDVALNNPTLATDGKWLLVASTDGSLMLRSVMDELVKLNLSDR